MNLIELLRAFGASDELIALAEAWVNSAADGAEPMADDALASLREQLQGLADDETAGVGLLMAAADVVDAIGTEQTARSEALAAEEAERDAAIARLRGDTPEVNGSDDDEDNEADPPDAPDEAPDGSEPAPSETETPDVVSPEDRPVVGENEPEPVTAAARADAARARRRSPAEVARRQPPQADPAPDAGDVATLHFAADVPNVAAGQAMPANRAGVLAVSEAMVRRYDSFRRNRAPFRSEVEARQSGSEEFIPIATLRANYDEDRRLIDAHGKYVSATQMSEIVGRVLGQHVTPEAILAAGGLCAPLMPYYGVEILGATGRPVADEALVTFQANRGGIVSFVPPVLPSTSLGVAVWTMDDDEQAASDPSHTKHIADVICGETNTTEIHAITARLNFGLVLDRTFREWSQSFMDLQAIAYDRLAEQTLLSQVKAGSKQPNTLTTSVSATRDLLNYIDQAAWSIRSRNRTLRTFPFRVVLPEVVLAVIARDMANALPGVSVDDNFAVALSRIQNWFSSRFLNVTWSPDMSVIGPQADATALAALPPTVECAVYPEGTWLRLDAGEVDYGVVRDTTTIEVNNFQTFGEGFEAAHRLGPESLWLTINVCPSGAANGTLDPAGMCASYT